MNSMLRGRALGVVAALILAACSSNNQGGGDTGAGGDVVPGDGSAALDVTVALDGGADVTTALDAAQDVVRDTGPGRDGGMNGEVCDNGLDDNGNGMVDEGCSCAPGATQRCFAGPASQAGLGVCAWGTQRCEGSSEFGLWGACTGAGAASTEVCDLADNNCDGVVDEGCACMPGAMRACYPGPAGTQGVGICRGGTQTCVVDGAGSAVWSNCGGAVGPSAETCGNGADDNCDGMVDEGCVCAAGTTRSCYDGPTGTAGMGVCRAGTQSCEAYAGGTRWTTTCVGQVLPGASEICGDATDNDCDGMVDEGCECPAGTTRACYAGAAGTAGVGICRSGTQTCEAYAGGTRWSPTCTGQVLPGATDVCGDMQDNDCNGVVDNGCVCAAGATRSCYDGAAGTAGVGPCRAGTQTCNASGTAWSACAGQVTPSAELCTDSVDNDCDGVTNDGCVCTPGGLMVCYYGTPGTAGVGVCHSGLQTCNAAGTEWSACTDAVMPSPEVCGDGLDNDCDGLAEETCPVCVYASSSVWQQYTTSGPICFGTTYTVHGDPAMYSFASIPAETDGGWVAQASPTISFSGASRLCGTSCYCLDGGDFTYFQTFFTIPNAYTVRNLVVSVGTVDDGVRITLFNSRYPSGVTPPGSYAMLGGGSTTDLASYAAPGRNRVVLTHVDDCCSDRAIANATVTLNGNALTQCM